MVAMCQPSPLPFFAGLSPPTLVARQLLKKYDDRYAHAAYALSPRTARLVTVRAAFLLGSLPTLNTWIQFALGASTSSMISGPPVMRWLASVGSILNGLEKSAAVIGGAMLVQLLPPSVV